MAKRRRAAAPVPTTVVADYHRQPTGVWRATMTIRGTAVRTLRASDPGAALSAVLDELKVLADEHAEPLATLHTLDGDPHAWAELAHELELGRLVDGD